MERWFNVTDEEAYGCPRAGNYLMGLTAIGDAAPKYAKIINKAINVGATLTDIVGLGIVAFGHNPAGLELVAGSEVVRNIANAVSRHKYPVSKEEKIQKEENHYKKR